MLYMQVDIKQLNLVDFEPIFRFHLIYIKYRFSKMDTI